MSGPPHPRSGSSLFWSFRGGSQSTRGSSIPGSQLQNTSSVRARGGSGTSRGERSVTGSYRNGTSSFNRISHGGSPMHGAGNVAPSTQGWNTNRGTGRSGRGVGFRGFAGRRGRGGTSYRGKNQVLVKLPDLLKLDADEVISFLNAKDEAFGEVMKSDFYGVEGKEQLKALVNILGEKLCGPVILIQQRNPLVAKCCTESFLHHVNTLVLGLVDSFSGPGAETSERILWSVYHFAKFVTEKMPSQVDTFLTLTQTALLVTENRKSNSPSQNFQTLDKLINELQELKEMVLDYKSRRDEAVRESTSALQSEKKIAAMARRWREPPPNDFRSIPVIPTAEELLSDQQVFLRPSLTQGKYPSAQDYLDVHFRLLREDYVVPLRQGVKDYFLIKRKQKQMKAGSVKIYENVELLTRLNFETHTPYYVMRLDYANSRHLLRVKWDKSKRLLPQSLILLTKDDFENVYFATVCKRDSQELQNSGTFGIVWEGKKPEFCPGSYFDIVESDVYFESYRHTLSTLKQVSLDEFPMKKYILDAEKEHRVPAYIKQITEPVNFQPLISSCEVAGDESSSRAADITVGDINNTLTWPSAEQFGMDKSQYEAFCAALTREISIIQGPPGTGKTFIAVQIAKFLLANQKIFLPMESCIREEEDNEVELKEPLSRDIKLSYDGRPVLVVCYTNHALDQFLTAVLNIMESMNINPKDNLVRVGFQTKSEYLKELTIHNRLEAAKLSKSLPYHLACRLNQARVEIKEKKQHRLELLNSLKQLKEAVSILDLAKYFQKIESLISSFLNKAETRFLWSLNDKSDPLMCGKQKSLTTIFGLNGRIFYYPYFSSSRWISQTFGSSPITQRHGNANTKETNPTQVNSLIPESGDGEVEEDYDLEELMANRVHEIEFEVDNDVSQKPEASDAHLFNPNDNPSKSPSLIEIRKAINEELKKPRELRNESLLMQLKYNLSTETDRISRQYMTVKDVITNYHDNKIRLTELNEADFEAHVESLYRNVAVPCKIVWTMYFQMLQKCRKLTLEKIFKLEEELVTDNEAYKETQNACYGHILKQAKFVGMTTTGAAKYHSLLPIMKSRLVIVEEAAEVLESHIVACITEHCEHLILIGDHKQLRPKTAVYKLGQDFNLEVSLFERMINNELNLHRLGVQHRMRPEICKLIVPAIYDKLDNHASVFEYPPVPGVESNLFFVSHKEPESQEDDSTSKSNFHEARFLVRLCRHLMLQGYKPHQITILTTYIGQMFLIKKMMRTEPYYCQNVRVSVVDNFQGEENDLILLSLVRSNDENKIGFLKTDNRICVALSRAKHGFFVIGNMNSMVTSSKTWKGIVDMLSQNDKIGSNLILNCQIHGDAMSVANASDFDKAPEGGCSKMCLAVLEKCGHICPRICHVQDKEHVEYQCRLPCERKCPNYGHSCPALCYEATKCYEAKCYHGVDTLLSCGHRQNLACHIDVNTYCCPVRVTKQLPCSHHLPMLCSEDPVTACCRKIIAKQLPCGHNQDACCFFKIEEVKCVTKLEVNKPNCQHSIEIACHQRKDPSSWVCLTMCDVRLDCGHSCIMRCHAEKDPMHENYKCNKDCARTCENGHQCGEGLEFNHKCYSKCPKCETLVQKKLQCGHEAEIPCYLSVEETHIVQCQTPVLKKSIDCPHEIHVPCYQIASKEFCRELITSKKKSPCGHHVEIPCNLVDKVESEDLPKYCEVPCGQQLFDTDSEIGCRHICSGSCSKCFRGRLHQKCQQKCDRLLVCGCVCKSSCAAVCPPCREKCQVRCTHSKCKEICGIVCSSCKERCDWKCKHAKCKRRCGEMCDREPCNAPCEKRLHCGHPCVGLCSEACPKLCRICNEDALTEIFFGNEGDENARYVMLEDCNHVFEVRGLDAWMLQTPDQDKRAVGVKRCPKCRTIVRTSCRYGNALKSSYAEIIRVKEQIFGKQKVITEELNGLANRLEGQMKPYSSNSADPTFFFVVYISQKFFKKSDNPFLPVERNKYRYLSRRDRIRKDVSSDGLESLTNMVHWWLEAVKYIRLPDRTTHLGRREPPQNPNTSSPLKGSRQREHPRALSKKYCEELERNYVDLLKKVTERQFPLSRLEIKQFSMEFDRLADLFQLLRRCSVDEYIDIELNIKRKCDQLKTWLLHDPNVYNSCSQKKFQEELEKVDEMMKLHLPVIQRETLQKIFSALDSAGTWYACPNQHIYLIGNCGNPNETSACPDCQAVIGASAYHVAAAGNTRISDHRQLPSLTNLRNTPDFLQ